MSTTHLYSTTYDKSIVYDPENGDHALYLDGSLVGFARTHQEAEITLDQLVSILRTGGTHITAALTRDLPHPSTDAIAEALGLAEPGHSQIRDWLQRADDLPGAQRPLRAPY
jgi:hypothetical protein